MTDDVSPADDGPVIDEVLDAAIHGADLEALVRCVDDRVATRDWAGLLRLRDRCRAAVRTGRQLWPAATLAEYRLALWAPAEWAVAAIDDEAGRFTPGPLSEVIATHHTWAELAPLLPLGPIRDIVAHERALRGDDIDEGDSSANPTAVGAVRVLDLPTKPRPWEPEYLHPTYTDDGCDAPAPPRPTGLTPVDLSPHPQVIVDDDDTLDAFRALVQVWTDDSTARTEMICVDGDHVAALSAVGPRHIRAVDIDLNAALTHLVWAGASGAAHGRRRGVATARFNVWWLLATMCDVDHDWGDGAELGAAVQALRWWWWDTTEPAAGWELRLVAHSPDDGLSWVFLAVDGG